MSAFVVSKEHIDVLVQAALHGAKDSEPTYHGDTLRWQIDPAGPFSRENVRELVAYEGASANYQPMTPDEFGDMLVRENVRSVIGRYPDTLDGTPMPGPIQEYWNAPYRFPEGVKPMVPGMAAIVVAAHPDIETTVRRLTSVEVLKTIHCLNYQSCEHAEWETSEAKSALEALSEAITHRLPGYDAAPWGL
jgi:hypothetical protein